jgi:hypothetical protein
MVRHHVLIGLGFKRQNFRNRALKYLMDRKILGRGSMTMRPAVMPPSLSRPTKGSGETMRPAVMPPSYSRPRAPLKFNY